MFLIIDLFCSLRLFNINVRDDEHDTSDLIELLHRSWQRNERHWAYLAMQPLTCTCVESVLRECNDCVGRSENSMFCVASNAYFEIRHDRDKNVGARTSLTTADLKSRSTSSSRVSSVRKRLNVADAIDGAIVCRVGVSLRRH